MTCADCHTEIDAGDLSMNNGPDVHWHYECAPWVKDGTYRTPKEHIKGLLNRMKTGDKEAEQEFWADQLALINTIKASK